MQTEPVDCYLETDGVCLRYRDEGCGPPVLLVHGWTLDLEMWDAQATDLSDAFRVIRLDRRGFGLSSGRPSTAKDAADLSALCAHFKLDSVALVGMSQGARAVMQFAGTFPKATSCVVLDGPPQMGGGRRVGGSMEVPYEHYRELAQSQGLAVFRDEWSTHALTKLQTEDEKAQASLARMIARYPGRDLTDTTPPSAALPLHQSIESMNRPCMVINGELDLGSLKKSGRQLALELPHAEYVQIPGAGHLCNLDQPRTYNQVLRKFLEEFAITSTTS